MDKHYFGTDGVRGCVGKHPITPDFLVRLGFAAGKVLAAEKPREVLIGKDTRLSGYMIESALEAGLSAAGVDVLLSGPLPTSAVAYLTQALRLSAGIVISASHNPHHDNGVKFFAADGKKLPHAVEQAIEEEIAKTDSLSFDGDPGRARRLDNAAGRYIEFCKRAFPSPLNLRDKRIVVDCANGAAYHVAPPVFHELGADIIVLNDAPNGANINVECGALSPQAAIDEVRRVGADIGVVLDGDADRVLLVDEKGNLWDGDALLYLIAKSGKRHGCPPSGVVGTVLSNLALQHRLNDLQVDFYRADVGDRNVHAALQERGWQVGGEPSGHVIVRDFHDTGDGIIAALQALRAMCETGETLSSLFADFQPYPQESHNLTVPQPRDFLRQPPVAAALAELHAELGNNIRLVVRPSGTEPLIRIMAEGEERAELKKLIGRVVDVIAANAL